MKLDWYYISLTRSVSTFILYIITIIKVHNNNESIALKMYFECPILPFSRG